MGLILSNIADKRSKLFSFAKVFMRYATYAGLFIALVSQPALSADRKEKSERLVRKAADSLRYFVEDSDFTGLWKTAENAHAIIIVPRSARAGFIFGGSAGDAVMVARNADGSWSGPTFLTLGSVSFGLQAGGEVSELVLLAMTNRGKERILSSNAKLGGDISIAAGPVGIGAKAKTADILAFSRSRGLYGGLSLEGSLLKIRHKLNHAYYGAAVTPVDIVYKGVQDNPSSLPLRDMALNLANRHEVHVANRIQSRSTATAENISSQYSRQDTVQGSRVLNSENGSSYNEGTSGTGRIYNRTNTWNRKNPESYSQDSYSQDSYSQDSYSPNSYSQDSYSQDSYSQGSYPSNSYSQDSYSSGSYNQGTITSSSVPPLDGPVTTLSTNGSLTRSPEQPVATREPYYPGSTPYPNTNTDNRSIYRDGVYEDNIYKEPVYDDDAIYGAPLAPSN